MTTSRRTLLTAALALPLAAALASLPRTSLAAPPPEPGDPEFPRYLLDQVDDVHRGRSSHADMTMKVKTEHWERSMKLESWSLGEDYSLIRILEPKKERGTATLKSKGDLFTYLSKTGRTIKISGASMGGSWMGSHFTNDDLIKDSRLADDFDYKLEEGPTIEGEATWAVVLMPKPSAVVVWGRIDVMVRKSDRMPAAELFYDEDQKPVRKLEFSGYRTQGARIVPSRMRMTPLDKSGEYTEVSYEKLEFDIDLKPEFFSVQQLKAL
ncbi:outer membrane lipoprotein-sorting protein [Pseudenhygromyxa sp. WMMC2535]|uniref:outer membrane lipoprotein-sorting protein n=1 Tax=Pseudenhygromyxa sp. WMMC2535 TaxID=2712867 RepID=UPI0015573643|nr:outer membrane lipoprotein-sorting protein [Pseudenhygromyxa sp. WMMC2535]NVB38645.1 outer membrane lipoprotein-sorting protein [Pseudenhygromyxa sp. WMMC2535]